MRQFIGPAEFLFVSVYSAILWATPLVTAGVVTPLALLALAALSGVLTIAYRRLMTSTARRDAEENWREALLTIISAAAACCSVVLLAGFLMSEPAQRGLGAWAFSWISTAPFATGLLRYGIERAATKVGSTRLTAIAVSTAAKAEAITQATSKMHFWDWLSVYCCDRQSDMSALTELARRGLVDVVVIDIATVFGAEWQRLLSSLADIPVRICVAVEADNLDLVGQNEGLILADIGISPLHPMQATVKRLVDILFSVIALIVIAPVLLLSAAAIRLETKGSPIYRQWRSGLNGRPFEVLKFRTMRVEMCDTTAQKQTSFNDPRVTRVGRFLRQTSIDEIPQLINVLRGEMSLVGPRAHPLHMKVAGMAYADIVRSYPVRHRVKPGITGWAQVNGSRGEVSDAHAAHRRVELDLFYLNHWSLLLDLEIMWRTMLGGFIARER